MFFQKSLSTQTALVVMVLNGINFKDCSSCLFEFIVLLPLRIVRSYRQLSPRGISGNIWWRHHQQRQLWDFFHYIFICCITLVDLNILNQVCISGMQPACSRCVYDFNVFLNLFFMCFLKNFCIYVYQRNWFVVVIFVL